MDTAPSSTPSPAPARAVFEDGLGRRHYAHLPGGEPLEALELREELSTATFEAALRERIAALGAFQHSCFARVRGVQRLKQNAAKLLVVSDRVPGVRLSVVLAGARQRLLPLPAGATLGVIRQLVSAIALLHEKLPSLAHGAIAAERMVMTPEARVIVVDHTLGAALAQLRYTPDQYWRELRVPLPIDREPAFDRRADVMQIGIVALGLMLDRLVDVDEYPAQLEGLVERACAGANAHRFPAGMREWLVRMLQLDPASDFASAADAWVELERVLGASEHAASFDALAAFMAEYARAMAAPAADPTVVVTPALPVASTPVPPPPVRPAAAAPVPAPSAAVPAAPRPPAPAAASPAPVAASPTPSTARALQSLDLARGNAAEPPAKLVAITAPPPFAPAPVAASDPPSTEQAVLPVGVPVRSTVASSGVTSLFYTPAPEEPEAARPTRHRWRWLAAAAAVLLLGSGGALFGRRYVNLMTPAVAEAPGTLAVVTNPAGVQVVVDGQSRGVTPLTVEVAPGTHELRLLTEGEPRIIPFTVSAGSTVSHTIEMAKTAPTTGQLAIRTDPVGARVTFDGTPVGVTPITLIELAPGPHTVTLATDATSVTQEVIVEAGNTASLVVPMSASANVPVSGWIAVTAPEEVQIHQDDRLLGTSLSDRIMMPVGRHELTMVNEALGYRVVRPVTIVAGKTSPIRLEWPNGSLAINAQPWAAVWVDGESKGDTPIGNITVPIGSHEIVFRHPELGERVVRAIVTASTPARISVDMSKR